MGSATEPIQVNLVGRMMLLENARRRALYHSVRLADPHEIASPPSGDIVRLVPGLTAEATIAAVPATGFDGLVADGTASRFQPLRAAAMTATLSRSVDQPSAWLQVLRGLGMSSGNDLCGDGDACAADLYAGAVHHGAVRIGAAAEGAGPYAGRNLADLASAAAGPRRRRDPLAQFLLDLGGLNPQDVQDPVGRTAGVGGQDEQ